MDSKSRDESEEQPSFDKKLKGHLLLVETKSISQKLTDIQNKDQRKKNFRKLHIVEINDPVGSLNAQSQKTNALKQGKGKNSMQTLE